MTTLQTFLTLQSTFYIIIEKVYHQRHYVGYVWIHFNGALNVKTAHQIPAHKLNDVTFFSAGA